MGFMVKIGPIQYTPAAVASENAQLFAAQPGDIITDLVEHVLVAGDGSGTLGFGTTSGGVDLASTANVAVTATGIKTASATNKVGINSGAVSGVWATYTVGTATIKPVVRISFTVIRSGLRL